MRAFCASSTKPVSSSKHSEERPFDNEEVYLRDAKGECIMAIDGMKVIDLDSHLVGDLESWDQTIEAKYKEFLPHKLPTKDNERRKTLVGNQIMIGSELGRQKAEKKEWVTADDLTAQGRVRNMDLDGIDVAVLSPNSPALDILWFVDDSELAAAYARAQHNYMHYYASQQPGRLMWAGE